MGAVPGEIRADEQFGCRACALIRHTGGTQQARSELLQLQRVQSDARHSPSYPSGAGSTVSNFVVMDAVAMPRGT